MPISALPSPYGVGTLGSEAFRFVDFLRDAGCGLWQMLPLQPTLDASPFHPFAGLAFDPVLIDPEFLIRDGLLRKQEVAGTDWGSDPRRVDFAKVVRGRIPLLKKAFARFDRSDPEWRIFLERGRYRDFALFAALKEHFSGAPFAEWGDYSVYGEPCEAFAAEHAESIEFYEFTQFLFLKQWRKLKSYANGHGVEIMGALPVFVPLESVENWKYRSELFLTDEKGENAFRVAPPPGANAGEDFGFCAYDWDRQKQDGYSWWSGRIKFGLAMFDILVLEPFSGFVRSYCVPAHGGEGTWKRGPGAELFRGFEENRIVAGVPSPMSSEVKELVRRTGYIEMRVLQNAFDGDSSNENKPSNFTPGLYACIGTQDDEVIYETVLSSTGLPRTMLFADLKSECLKAGVTPRMSSDEAVSRTVLQLLYASRAEKVVFRMQDALLMRGESRINKLFTASDRNWTFRFKSADFSTVLKRRLNELAAKSGRK